MVCTMIIGLFAGATFITFLFLVVWSVRRKDERHRAFQFSLSLVACWALLLYFGVTPPLGYLPAVIGIIISVWALLAPFKKVNETKEVTKEIFDDIELAYVSYYRECDDPSQGPMSGIGTMSDYNRMLMGFMFLVEEKYPDISLDSDIMQKLKNNGPKFRSEMIDVPGPLKMICKQIVNDLEENNGQPSESAKEEGYIVHYSPAGGLIAIGFPVPDSDEFEVTLHPYEPGTFHLRLNEKKVAAIALGERKEIGVYRCTFKNCTKKFYDKRLVCENCTFDPA